MKDMRSQVLESDVCFDVDFFEGGREILSAAPQGAISWSKTASFSRESHYYYGARYYCPEIGRFIQPDTVLDGLNRYAYCWNNPMNYTDPTGNYIADYSHGAPIHHPDPLTSYPADLSGKGPLGGDSSTTGGSSGTGGSGTNKSDGSESGKKGTPNTGTNATVTPPVANADLSNPYSNGSPGWSAKYGKNPTIPSNSPSSPGSSSPSNPGSESKPGALQEIGNIFKDQFQRWGDTANKFGNGNWEDGFGDIFGHTSTEFWNGAGDWGMALGGVGALGEGLGQAPALVSGAVSKSKSIIASITAVSGAAATTVEITQIAGNLTTKSAARDIINSLGLSAGQAASALSAINRATTTSTISISQQGGNIIIKIARAGNNGFQVIQSIIDTIGSKQVVQLAYDNLGNLVHNHIK
jgi:RHS repeat-associated protein